MASKVALTSVLHPMSKHDPLLNWDAEFLDLEECSLVYQTAFKSAWKAIEHGSQRRLKDSIENLKRSAADETKCLDVCHLQFTVSFSERKRTSYYMTLLAFAAVHGQKDMVKELLENKANTRTGNCLSGSPLTQALVYAQHHNCPDAVDGEIIQLLMDTELDINVFYLVYTDGNHTQYGACSPIELAVDIKRIDIAQQLVMAGANPIHPSLDEVDGVLQILEEYYEFGTNQYICWLLHEHLLSNELPQFIKTVLELDIFNDGGMAMFNEVGRHPAHALLMCGNEEMVRQLLIKQHSYLSVKDATQRTALQIATEKGDLESVEILLKFYSPDDRQDVALSLMAAAKKGDIKIVRCFVEDDVHVMLDRLPNGKLVIDQAKEEGLTSLFEVILHDFPFVYKKLTNSRDKDGNTLVHSAALTGNARLFKVFFPLQPKMAHMGRTDSDAHEFQREISSEHARTMFEALTLGNKGKTPLHLAIDKDQLCILRTLESRIAERESNPGVEQNKEKNAWEVFWKKWGPKLFIYACSRGSVEAVKFFMEMGCPLYSSDKNDTPLSAAARCGRNRTLQYLLDDCGYSVQTPSKRSPLLLAAERGHATCVSILLKKGADVREKSKYGYNCLMIATERKHRSTVLAILSDKQGFEALRCKKESVTPMRMLIEHLPDAAEWALNRCVLEGQKLKISYADDPKSDKVDETDGKALGVLETGFNSIMLKDIPAKYAEPDHLSVDDDDDGDDDDDDDVDESAERALLLHEFEFLEDFKLSASKAQLEETDIGEEGDETDNDDLNWQPDDCSSSNHTIKIMVKHNRKNLLDHALVKGLISYKWWRIGLPFLLFSYGFHLLFLVMLTAFALVIPRPGPTCTQLLQVENLTTNFTDEEFAVGSGSLVTGSNESNTGKMSCEGTGMNESQTTFLSFAAAVVILMCIAYLLLEALQIYRRGLRKYLVDILNYFQIITCACVVIFVFPLGHRCWCYPSWKWQIGALAIFLAWMNNLVLLKDIPYAGKPITMLFNVYQNFILLIYLPILLILTFAFPFYMLFIATVENSTSVERFFSTPFDAIWDVILQTAGGPDSQLFVATLSHKIMTYTLFIIFIVAVPVLFNNFLIGVAVGETEEERKKAKLSIIKSKVEYIFECEDTIPFFRKFSFASKPPALKICAHKLELLEQQNKTVLEMIELNGDTQKSSRIDDEKTA